MSAEISPSLTPYLEEAHKAFGRVLSSLAREEGYGNTVGSFDRTWWCWKFTDFSASRFQEGIYSLCWMVAHPEAHEHDEEHLLKLIEQALLFWRGLQHKNGAFDEAYPYEYSLAATAFTAFYIGEGLALILDKLDAKTQRMALDTIGAAAQWLADNGEFHGVLSNHLAAAAGALHVAYRLLKKEDFAKARERYLAQIWQHQDKDEGWMLEYGGADPGYQSHGLFYLAQIYVSADPATKRRMYEPLSKALAFQKYFLHPDGSFGGEYASRGTCFAFPAAFEILAPEFEDARALTPHLRAFIKRQKIIGPSDMDRWNLFPMLNNYLFAHDAALKSKAMDKEVPLFWQWGDDVKHFEKAGIWLHKKGALLTIISSLGGTVKQWNCDSGKLLYSDCGYVVFGQRAIYSSQNARSDFKIEGEKITVKTSFSSLPQTVMSPFKFLLFRGFTLTLGRLPRVAKAVKNILVKVLIKNKKTCDITLQRVIDVSGGLHIQDNISGLASEQDIKAVAHHVPVHMGSARYVGRDFSLLAPISQPEREKGASSAQRDFRLNIEELKKQEAAA
jgi:hypothetical protein